MTRLKKLTEFKAKVLVACILAYLSSWLIIITFTYLAFENQQAAYHLKIRTEFERQYAGLFAARTRNFEAWLDILAAKPELDGHLTQDDNNYLYLLYESEFSRLQSGTDVTHLSISDKKRNNIVRLQTPNKFGDHIPRYESLTLNNSRATSGLYLSKNGVLTQRVMKPLYKGETHTGFMEIGAEIYNISDFIAKQYDISVFFLVAKNQLTQSAWEQGKKTFDWPGQWDDMEDFVLCGGTNFRNMLDGQLEEYFLLGSRDTLGEMTFQGKTFLHDFLPLSVSDRGRVGTVFYAYPQSEAIVRFTGVLTGGFTASSFAFVIGLTICYYFLKPIATAMATRQSELEEKVSTQTRDLMAAKERAVIERNRAVLANKTKSDFLSNMSHELRTPLNSIIGFSSILKNDEFGDGISDRYGSYVNDIHKSGTHLLAIINDILDVSRIEAGEMSLRIQDINVNALLADCQRMINMRATDRHIAILHDRYDEKLMISADPTRLKQIVLNLLTNAVKFTSAPGIIRFSAKKIVGSRIRFEISDEGIGVAKSDIPDVLRRFGQVPGNVLKKDQEEGTGLGLTLVQDLVKMHGGSVNFNSTLGEGTIVSFVLPIVHEPAEDTQMI